MVQISGLSNFSLVSFCVFVYQSRFLREVYFDFKYLCINSCLSIISLLKKRKNKKPKPQKAQTQLQINK